MLDFTVEKKSKLEITQSRRGYSIWKKLVRLRILQSFNILGQTDEIVVFSFILNSDVFDLSHVSLSELRCQDPRYASDFLLLLIDQ